MDYKTRSVCDVYLNWGMHLNPARSRYPFEYKGFLTFCGFIIKIC